MESSFLNKDYKNWLVDFKNQIRNNQLKATLAVNATLINFYWEIGKMISEKEQVWGNKLISILSKDLNVEFPDLKGFSERNLIYCRSFYNFYNNLIAQQLVAQTLDNTSQQIPITQQAVAQLQNIDNQENIIVQQAVAQIPWGHNIVIFSKSKTVKEAQFYIEKTIENQWSRSVLTLQIESDLFFRQGKIISNFHQTLLQPHSDLAQQTLKDPYIFGFLSLDEKFKEKDLENQLILKVEKFLLELGKGFAFVGRQYHFNIAENDYYLDLLFYHIHLKCYVVIDLKNTEFVPEFAGKMNFYLSAIDDLLKKSDDNPTIGLLLCKSKNNLEVEFTLRGMSKPIGVSEFILTNNLPEKLKSSLPSIDEIERELSSVKTEKN